MKKTVKFTIAKPTDKDVENVNSFFKAASEVLVKKPFGARHPEDNWQSWEEDDPEKKLMQKIEKRIRQEEEIAADTPIDNRVLMFEYLQVKAVAANSSSARVFLALTTEK